METNAASTFVSNQAVFLHLKDKGAVILNFAGSAGIIGYVGKAHYAYRCGLQSGVVGRGIEYQSLYFARYYRHGDDTVSQR
ncbi:hypothetical protein FACS1894172_13190 [Spirochaetia bacterium]|nr:hypothetical protein FACS1894164_21340 [Spirochaetia bacterium]GHU33843.1 hypothetical protein FACS1894172_13190 [Spirochaetia bacterium]